MQQQVRNSTKHLQQTSGVRLTTDKNASGILLLRKQKSTQLDNKAPPVCLNQLVDSKVQTQFNQQV